VKSPETNILKPVQDGEYFILPHITDYWHGIPFTFQGSDEDGEVVSFSYQVDNEPWSEWISDTTVYITPGYFTMPLSGMHSLKAKAKDNTDVEDPTPAEVSFKLFEASFNKSILVLDETFNGAGNVFSPNDEMVDTFYDSVINRNIDSWDYTKDNGVPSKDILGQYRLLIWHSDDKDQNEVYKYQEYLQMRSTKCYGYRSAGFYRRFGAKWFSGCEHRFYQGYPFLLWKTALCEHTDPGYFCRTYFSIPLCIQQARY